MAKSKKLLSVLVCLAMALALAPGLTAWAAEEGVTDDGLGYHMYDDHVAITKYIGSATEVDIPAEIEDMPVTSIGMSAFTNCTDITSVTIPNSVTEFDWYAFEGCTNLTDVVIPDSLIDIGNYAFADCTSLQSVIIPSGVSYVGAGAFENCTSLVEINVDADNSTYADQDGVLFDKEMTYLMQYPAGNTRTDYTIPNGVTDVSFKAFSNCKNLEIINISSSVSDLAIDVFLGCTNITEINVDVNNTTYASLNGVLFNKEITSLIKYPVGNARTNYAIPKGVTNICEYAFMECENLENVTIPNSVIDIDSCAFTSCTNLVSITIPHSVTGIGLSAFSGCTGLKNAVILANGYIGMYAFQNCSGLTSVTISDSVTSIGFWSFLSCTGLTDIYYGGSKDDWDKFHIVNNDYGFAPLFNANKHYNSVMPEPEPEPEIKATVKPNGAGGGLSVTVETVNVPASAELIAAAIGADGNVIDIALAENGEAALDGESVKTIKLFCWESLETMKPLCPAKEVDVTR